MIGNNLCYSTQVSLEYIRKMGWKEGIDYIKTPTPTPHYFVTGKHREGILPQILKELLSERKKAKGNMWKAKDEGNGKNVNSKLDNAMFKDLSSVSDNFNEVINTFDIVSKSFRSITRDFEQNIGQISSLSKALHDDILQVRLVPTQMLFNRFPRAVRDMAKDLKKKVNLVVEGEETEMDRALIESLTDPVMHLVRNAIDHGIETPTERKARLNQLLRSRGLATIVRLV